MNHFLENTQKLEQNLSPQLLKSLNLLQLASIDLEKELYEEFENNPMLEEIPNSYDEQVSMGSSSTQARDFFLNSLPDEESLYEHLLNQANIDSRNSNVKSTLVDMLGYLDDRGFLPKDIFEILNDKSHSQKHIEEALAILRSYQPSGIGAFDTRDSLLLQLKNLGEESSLAYLIIDNHYDLLLKRKVLEIANLCKVNPPQIEEAISQIATLNTSPARDFEQSSSKYIKPDIIYRKNKGTWDIELTNAYIPQLRINSDYRQLVAQNKLSSEEEKYIRQKTNDAKFLVNALSQRQNTLYKIAKEILSEQIQFFEGGTLKPMTMQYLADKIGVHSTTISRAVSEKYVQIQGKKNILALKFFFSTGFDTSADTAIASNSIKDRIKQIIENEDPHKPLSDEKIANLLSQEKVDIARRTVAKYREQLNIPIKSLRKRF